MSTATADAPSPPGRDIRKRTTLLLLAVALLGIPAAAMRALCVGRACERAAGPASDTPFCSLPEGVRDRVAAGFWEGRSPDVVAVTRTPSIAGGSGLHGRAPAWPSLESGGRARVPLVLWGRGVRPGTLPRARLDAVAPTLAAVIGLSRPHPEVRSGRALAAGSFTGSAPRLVVEIVLKGIGSAEVEARRQAWSELRRLAETGAATFDADVGSLPLDPAAVMTTIGTGGLPRQHGIPGTTMRNDEGRLVRAWSRRAPVSVIATLADDLDELGGQRPLIGLVTTDVSDRGLVGGRWYVDTDRDEIVIPDRGPQRAAAAVRDLLDGGFGRDRVTDLLAVVLTGAARATDAAIGDIVAGARAAAGGSVTVVVTATASGAPQSAGGAGAVARAIQRPDRLQGTIAAAVPGGLYLDQRVLAARAIPEDEIVGALRRLRVGGRRLFADAFGAIAISFGRYC